jgi:4-carboxymuconolactone decarboxylase
MSDSKRYREFHRGVLSSEQQQVFDRIAAPRGGVVPAPFHILIESPTLASLTQELGAFCRYRTGFRPQLSELMVLLTAAHWRADYEFSVHIPEAKKAGLSDETIAAVREGRVPKLDDPDVKLVYDFTTTFYSNREVPDALFDAAVARFGRPRVVEFIGVLGYYSMLAIFMRVFRVEGLNGFKFES